MAASKAQLHKLVLLLFPAVFHCGCSQGGEAPDAPEQPPADSAAPNGEVNIQTRPAPTGSAAPSTSAASVALGSSSADYQTIEWTDLMPKEDLDALMNPPEYLDEIEDGSQADQVGSQMRVDPGQAELDDYQQALMSTKIKDEFNNRRIRLPGFIVPLEFNDQQIITTFFLVPFFGACIHEPPPPPNQIIYAEFEPGIKLEALYDPFWVEGTLHTTLVENELATAAYSMIVNSISSYELPPEGE